MSTLNNPRIAPYTIDQDIISPEEVQIQIIEPPPLINRISRKAMYYTVGAIIEPQEPRYSALCVILSLALAFTGGILIKKCF